MSETSVDSNRNSNYWINELLLLSLFKWLVDSEAKLLASNKMQEDQKHKKVLSFFNQLCKGQYSLICMFNVKPLVLVIIFAYFCHTSLKDLVNPEGDRELSDHLLWFFYPCLMGPCCGSFPPVVSQWEGRFKGLVTGFILETYWYLPAGFFVPFDWISLSPLWIPNDW